MAWNYESRESARKLVRVDSRDSIFSAGLTT